MARALQVRTLRLIGSARDTLPLVARDEKCDLVVMASHGRTGIPCWLLGSVAEAVLRQAPCPVLLVRPGGQVPIDGFHKVVVPTDGSTASWSVAGRLGNFLAPQAGVTLVRASELAPTDYSV